MTYAPKSAGAVVTAAEWNEFASALDTEVTRATGAETTLAGRATDLETFQGVVNHVIPTSALGLSRYLGAEALVVDGLGTAALGLIGKCIGAGGGTAFVLALASAVVPDCKIVQVALEVTGANFATLPTALHFQIISYDVSTGTTTVEDSWTDNPANVGALNSRRSTGHVLGSPLTIGTKQYFLQVYNHIGGTDAGPTREISYHCATVVVSG